MEVHNNTTSKYIMLQRDPWPRLKNMEKRSRRV